MDVNVSPAKTQVRFADAGTAFRLVYHAVHSALLAGKEERRLRIRADRRAVVSEPSVDYGGTPSASFRRSGKPRRRAADPEARTRRPLPAA